MSLHASVHVHVIDMHGELAICTGGGQRGCVTYDPRGLRGYCPRFCDFCPNTTPLCPHQFQTIITSADQKQKLIIKQAVEATRRTVKRRRKLPQPIFEVVLLVSKQAICTTSPSSYPLVGSPSSAVGGSYTGKIPKSQTSQVPNSGRKTKESLRKLLLLLQPCSKSKHAEFEWKLGWSMLHVNCMQLIKFFFFAFSPLPNCNQLRKIKGLINPTKVLTTFTILLLSNRNPNILLYIHHRRKKKILPLNPSQLSELSGPMMEWIAVFLPNFPSESRKLQTMHGKKHPPIVDSASREDMNSTNLALGGVEKTHPSNGNLSPTKDPCPMLGDDLSSRGDSRERLVQNSPHKSTPRTNKKLTNGGALSRIHPPVSQPSSQGPQCYPCPPWHPMSVSTQNATQLHVNSQNVESESASSKNSSSYSERFNSTSTLGISQGILTWRFSKTRDRIKSEYWQENHGNICRIGFFCGCAGCCG
ncbi:hypothetical protein VP01_4958g2 [Puccinia sorghi]|uniref:Uncharacterized protein n=1 Tax=Puccinia sorghi TaxID=27349 RepID=A0A0L6ULY3_9BASI|nr:hypothetical protein VP01_4958g2 [Puccinia sorghi]